MAGLSCSVPTTSYFKPQAAFVYPILKSAAARTCTCGLQGLLGGDTPSLCVYMTSVVASVGSLPYADFSPLYAYRASKAALNALVRTMGAELAPRKVSTVLIHPGRGLSSSPVLVVRPRRKGQGACCQPGPGLAVIYGPHLILPCHAVMAHEQRLLCNS